jgi:transposase
MQKHRAKTAADTWRERCGFLEKENAFLREENAVLKGRVSDLEEKICMLMARIEKLEDQLKKNSRNSSKPPSSDTKEDQSKKNQSLREKTGRKPGGQKGRLGISRSQVDDPDHVIPCTPKACSGCGISFEEKPWTSSILLSARQEIDIPPIVPIVTEYQRMEVTCSCGAKTCGAFPSHLK